MQVALATPSQLLSHKRHKQFIGSINETARRRAEAALVLARVETQRLKAEQAELNNTNADLRRVVSESRDRADAARSELARLSGVLSEHVAASREIENPAKLSVAMIAATVARYYNVTMTDLVSERRTAAIVRPRQIAMYLAKTLTLRSLPEVGRRLGDRDHTTVLHGVRKIERLRALDPVLEADIQILKNILQPSELGETNV